MEKTHLGGVAMATFTWQDLGTWNALDEMTSRDQEGNVIIGNVLTEGVKNTYIHSTTGRPVVVMGVDNLVVVDTPDGVLVTRKDLAPDLSHMVPKLHKPEFISKVKV
jgi:mannose-1-phosphate guanylyltransferase